LPVTFDHRAVRDGAPPALHITSCQRRLHPRSRQRRRNAHTGIATPCWMTATCVVCCTSARLYNWAHPTVCLVAPAGKVPARTEPILSRMTCDHARHHRIHVWRARCSM